MKTLCCVGAVVAGLAAGLSSQPAHGTVIYSDAFGGSGALSANPDVSSGTDGGKNPGVWTKNGSATFTEGAGLLNIGTSAGHSNELLEFTAQTGKIYALQADITPVKGTTGDWIALGFAVPSPTGTWSDVTNWGSTNSSTGVSGGVAWALWGNAGGFAAFAGKGTSNEVTGTLPAGYAPQTGETTIDTVRIRIELNTTAANWTVKYFTQNLTDGAAGFTQYGSTFTYNGTSYPLTSGTPNVMAVGINAYKTAGTVDNFSLEVVPEPAGAAMLGLAGLAGLLRRRRANA